MDLLGGYGSDGSSSCDNNFDNEEEVEKKQVDVTRIPANTFTQQRKLLSVESNVTLKNQRAKKRVSLLAALPAHIVEQLTQQGTVDYHHYDSDDGGVVTSTTTPNNTTNVHHNDADISSFLSDLHAAPTRKLITNNTVTPVVRKIPVESLGKALISSETVKIRHDSCQQEVIDIHATVSACRDSIVVETPQDMVDHNQNDSHLPPKPLKIAPAPPRVSVPVPRPSTAHIPRDVVVSERPNALILIAAYSAHPMDDNHDPTTLENISRINKKRSRKEMEKALRSGNFDTLSGTNVQTLHNPSSAYAAPAPGEAPRHNVKVAPVRMYDTKAGTDVLGANISGKAKGKNQVNHLMAAAAAFELKESQGAFKPKSQKANAKRKYGW